MNCMNLLLLFQFEIGPFFPLRSTWRFIKAFLICLYCLEIQKNFFSSFSFFFLCFSLGVVDAIQDLIHAKYMPRLHFCPLQVELSSWAFSAFVSPWWRHVLDFVFERLSYFLQRSTSAILPGIRPEFL